MHDLGETFRQAVVARQITGINVGPVRVVTDPVGGRTDFQGEVDVENTTESRVTFDIVWEVDGSVIAEDLGLSLGGVFDPVNENTFSVTASASSGSHQLCATVENVEFDSAPDPVGSTETACEAFTIPEEPVSDISPSNMTVTPSSPWEVGENVETCVEFENTGTADGSTDVHDVFYNGSAVGSVFAATVPAGGTAEDCVVAQAPDANELVIEAAGFTETGSIEQPTANIVVTGISASPQAPWQVGQSVEIIVSFENIGDARGSDTRDVTINGSVVGSVSITLDAGASFSESTTVQMPDVDTAQISATGTGFFIEGDVQSATEPQADIQVTGVDAIPSPPWFVGETVQVDVTFENVGDGTGDESRDVLVNGSVVSDVLVTDLAPGEVATGSTSIQIPDTDSVTIGVGGTSETVSGDVAKADISVADLVVTPGDPWQPGDTVDVTVTFQNDGGAEGSITRDVIVNNQAVAQVSASVQAGEMATDTVSIQIPEQDPTEITVSQSSLSVSGQVDIPQDQPANIVIQALDISPGSPWQAGQTVDVTVTWENTGDQPGTAVAEIAVNGTVVDEISTDVFAGETASATGSVQIPNTDPTKIGIAGTDVSITGPVETEEQPPEDGEPPADGQPEIGREVLLIAGAVVVVAIALSAAD